MENHKLAMILVGDHLGQVKKVIPDTKEVIPLAGCAIPTSSNPVVSIEPNPRKQTEQIIANKNGELYRYNAISNETKVIKLGLAESLTKALPMRECRGIMAIYESHINLHIPKSGSDLFLKLKHKKSKIAGSKISPQGDKLAIVGPDLPLQVLDVETKKQTFKADFPEKDWLGIQPDCFVSDLVYVGGHRIATCSRSDSVIRLYDVNQSSKTRPIISINLNQTTSVEHADSARFHTIASTNDYGHSIVVGSNVGQLLAIDLRFNVKELPQKKKIKPRTYKVLGGFKGQRGGSIKDVKIVPHFEETGDGDVVEKHRVISCCLDRYLRLHKFSKNLREFDQLFYMTTKPYCCSPIFFE